MNHRAKPGAARATLVGQVVARLRKHGPLGALSLVGKNIGYYGRSYLDRSFDRRYGTRTSGIVPLETLTIDSVHAPLGVYYEAIAVKIFHRIVGSLDIDPKQFCFIDYGSGMGRTLLMASDYPFKFICGIEFAEALHAIAERNIAIYRSRKQRCSDIRSICIDAAAFDLPPLPTLLYMYNPFDLPLMRIVFQKIKDSLDAHPREFHIAYYNPLSAFVLDELGFMTQRREVPLRYDFTHKVQRRALVYSYHPTAIVGADPSRSPH